MPTVLITGAGRGVGLELVRLYLEREGVRVIAALRPKAEVPPVLAALSAAHRGRLFLVDVDLANPEALANLPARLSQRIDILVNAAGSVVEISPAVAGSRVTPSIRMGAVSPLRVASAMISNMTRGGKIAVVSAVRGHAATGDDNVRPNFEMDRLLRDFASDLKALGIAVAIVQPEAPRLGASLEEAEAGAKAAAAGIVDVIDRLTLERTGDLFVSPGAKSLSDADPIPLTKMRRNS